MGEVGDVEEEVVLFLGGDVSLGIERFDFRVDFAGEGFFLIGVFALASSHADFFREVFSLGLELLFFGFGGAAFFVEGDDFVDELPMVAAALLETFFDGVGVFTDDADVEHRSGR